MIIIIMIIIMIIKTIIIMIKIIIIISNNNNNINNKNNNKKETEGIINKTFALKFAYGGIPVASSIAVMPVLQMSAQLS
jgi:hypothetical protein